MTTPATWTGTIVHTPPAPFGYGGWLGFVLSGTEITDHEFRTLACRYARAEVALMRAQLAQIEAGGRVATGTFVEHV